MLAPLFLAGSFEPAQAKVVFVRLAVFIDKMCQLHGLEYPVHDHGRPETGAQSEKQHTAAFITAQRLHGSIVDDPDWAAKSFAEVKSHPSTAQVVGLAKGMLINDGAGIA